MFPSILQDRNDLFRLKNKHFSRDIHIRREREREIILLILNHNLKIHIAVTNFHFSLLQIESPNSNFSDIFRYDRSSIILVRKIGGL